MKITIKTRAVSPKQVFTVTSADYLSGYKLRITFSDGTSRIVDCAGFLNNAPHPSLKKYHSIARFKKFKVCNGNINWNNYEMIFPIENLYKGKVY
jgi:hypothetical protein